jgi:molybdate transport system permease protein
MDWSPLTISVKVSVAATIVAIVAGIPIAYTLSRRKFGGRALAQGLVNLPLVLPPTVLGYFLLVLLGRESVIGAAYQRVFHQSIVFTWQGAAIAAAVASLPLLITQARVAFDAVDRDIEDSARVFGANELQVFFRITLPLSERGVIAGIALSFARAMGDFGATLMVAGSIPGRTRTMPLAIYDALQTGDTRTILTFVVIASLITIVFTVSAAQYAGNLSGNRY